MQRRMVLRLPRDRRETGIAPITVPCGRPTPGWHSAALYTAQRSAIYWGLHHGGHPPHTGCDARVSPGAGCQAWGLQHCLLSPPLPASKYHPGKQNHSKRQQPTSCSHCSYVSIPCSRRTLGTICPSQLERFPGSHPALISAKPRKPSVEGDDSSEPLWTLKDEVNCCSGVPSFLL